jgi:hypothetical protein
MRVQGNARKSPERRRRWQLSEGCTLRDLSLLSQRRTQLVLESYCGGIYGYSRLGDERLFGCENRFMPAFRGTPV